VALHAVSLPFRKADSRRLGGPVVLLYHRIASGENDPFRVSVSPKRFAEQLQVIREMANPLPLETLVSAVEEGRPPGRGVAVTFDDGYADNLYEAKPLLEQAGIPATVFAVTGSFGDEFWWDTLARLLLEPASLPSELMIRIGEDDHHWSLTRLAERAARSRWLRRPRRQKSQSEAAALLLRELHSLLRRAEPQVRSQVLDRIARWSGGAARNGILSARSCRPEELARLADGGLVTLGAHTITHPSLRDLPSARQLREITDSKGAIEEIAGRPIHSFSYPFGQRSDFDESTAGLVQEAGFTSACAAWPGSFRRSRDRYRIPRLWIEDWDGERFASYLSGWIGRR